MAGGTIGWQLFDVESGVVPEGTSPSVLPGEGRGRIVVLAATPFSIEGGWAARATVEVARDWSAKGLRVFLMDLGLDWPSLHEVLDVPNGEGVSDAFMYGASIQHIARPVLDEAFFFAPAGSPPGDPEEVLGHSRWNDLAGGFSEADATLLLFLPTNLPGAQKILSRATDILFFSAQGESADRHLGPSAIKVVANAGPSGFPPGDLAGADVSGTPASDETVPGPSVDQDSHADREEGDFSDLVVSRDDPDREGSEAGDLHDPFKTGGEEEGATPGTQDTAFDFPGDLELAEGFWEETAPDEPGSAEPDREAEELPLPSDEPGAGGAGVSGVMDEQHETETEDGAAQEPGFEEFGDDLTMGSSLDPGADEKVRSGPPDFEPDFIDLPEEETGAFGEDLVQGPDFGSAPSPGAQAPASPPQQASAPPEPPPERPARNSSRDAPKTPPKRRSPPKKSFPYGVAATVVLVVAAMVAAVGTAVGYFNVPGLTFLQSYFGEIPDPPLTLAGPEPNEEVLRYSLVLDSYGQGELGVATEMLHALRTRLPGLLFSLVPGEEDGVRTYTLMAGPAYDRIEAENLRDPLAGILTREDPDSWVVQETPRAFYLGERETLAEAEEYLESFSAEGIYPYILHVSYPDGSAAFEVLAGAYEGVLDARPLQLILRENGLRDLPLIERRGRLPE